MKKLVILLLVLGCASIASASFYISVDGVVNPTEPVILTPIGTAVIDVHGVDNDKSARVMFLLVQGPGITAGGISLYGGDLDEVITRYQDPWDPIFEWLPYYGFEGVTSYTSITLGSTAPSPPVLNGKLVDLINFHCEGTGIMTLTLVGEDLATVYDTQTITVVPEPATIALLCLGGLMLRRRK
jgi:hypothetical protein